jgi:hypothetical protein
MTFLVGTLRIGYPRAQALSQDNGSRLPAEGSSEAVMCPRGSGSRSQLGAALGPPRVPTARAPAPSSGQLWGHHVSPWHGLLLPARGSSGATMYPRGTGSCSRLGEALGPLRVPAARAPPPGSGQLRGCHVSPGLCGLQANKQISSGDPAIMISIGAGTPVSSKALRDKGCSARMQGMQQVAH